jgi:hypothetical protein
MEQGGVKKSSEGMAKGREMGKGVVVADRVTGSFPDMFLGIEMGTGRRKVEQV